MTTQIKNPLGIPSELWVGHIFPKGPRNPNTQQVLNVLEPIRDMRTSLGSLYSKSTPLLWRALIHNTHPLTQEFVHLSSFCRVNRDFCIVLTEEKTNVTTKIINLIVSILEKPQGAVFLLDCIRSSFYLKTFQVYFSARPQDLKKLQDASGNNVFHALAKTSLFSLPSYFIDFLIDLDTTQGLRLLDQKNNEGFTPYQIAVHPFAPSVLTQSPLNFDQPRDLNKAIELQEKIAKGMSRAVLNLARSEVRGRQVKNLLVDTSIKASAVGLCFLVWAGVFKILSRIPGLSNGVSNLVHTSLKKLGTGFLQLKA